MSVYSLEHSKLRISFIISWIVWPFSVKVEDEAPGRDPDLERLADLSPHLMQDIGFRQLANGDWCNGRQRIKPKVQAPAVQTLHARGINS